MGDAAAPRESQGYFLNPLGQQPIVRCYTPLCLCFPTPDNAPDTRVVSTLRDGLARLSEGFPWLAGRVVDENAGTGKQAYYKIHYAGTIPLLVKDLRQDPTAPPFDDWRQAKFPMAARALDESIVPPRDNVPECFDDKSIVLIVQVTFLKGGLVLALISQHQILDMVGHGQVLYLLSKACHGEPFTAEELSNGNMDSRTLVPLLDEATTIKWESGGLKKIGFPAASPSQPSMSMPALSEQTTALFTFSAARLKELKAIGSESVTTGFISSDDALSALIWQSITRARLPRMTANYKPLSEVGSTLARAVDARSALAIPATQLGLLMKPTHTSLPVETITTAALGTVAARLRAELVPAQIAHEMRSWITNLTRQPEKAVISSLASQFNLATDVICSSWAKVGHVYALDFNLGLGRPEAARKPNYRPIVGQVHFMPKAPDGGVAVSICLRNEDMDALRKDVEFVKYAEYVG